MYKYEVFNSEYDHHIEYELRHEKNFSKEEIVSFLKDYKANERELYGKEIRIQCKYYGEALEPIIERSLKSYDKDGKIIQVNVASMIYRFLVDKYGFELYSPEMVCRIGYDLDDILVYVDKCGNTTEV